MSLLCRTECCLFWLILECSLGLLPVPMSLGRWIDANVGGIRFFPTHCVFCFQLLQFHGKWQSILGALMLSSWNFSSLVGFRLLPGRRESLICGVFIFIYLFTGYWPYSRLRTFSPNSSIIGVNLDVVSFHALKSTIPSKRSRTHLHCSENTPRVFELLFIDTQSPLLDLFHLPPPADPFRCGFTAFVSTYLRISSTSSPTEGNPKAKSKQSISVWTTFK